MAVTPNRLWLHAAAIEAYNHTSYFIRFRNSAKHSEPLIRRNRIIPSLWSDEGRDTQFSITERRKKTRLTMWIAAKWNEILHRPFHAITLQ
jgi:hypothetical protein